jgi:hypothetical protein
MPFKKKEDFNRARNIRCKKKRDLIFQLLGNRCVICGISDRRCLDLDHINNDGASERKKWGSNKNEQYLNLIIKSIHANEGRYQILCANHNRIKEWEHRKKENLS